MHKKKNQETSGDNFAAFGTWASMRSQIGAELQILACVFITESRSGSPLLNVIWTSMKLLDASGELQLCRCCRCWPTYQSEDLFLRLQYKLNSHIWKLPGKFDSFDQSVSVKSDPLKKNFPLEGASNTLAAATGV